MAPLVSIVFDEAEVAPGEELTGQVLVTNDKARRCGGIFLKFKGFAEVQCNRAARQAEIQNISSEEEFYKTKVQLWKDQSHVLGAGKHCFPISFRVPPNAPASFQSASGRVQHECKAHIKLKQSFDAKCKRVFEVTSQQYDGYEELLKKPQLRCDDSLVDKNGGAVLVKVGIDSTFYLPGDSIIIDADVSNQTNKKIRNSAVFYMEVQYHMRGARRTERYALNKIERPDILPEETDSWNQDKIEIPNVPTSGLDGCSIINISYGLQFTVSRKLPESSLVLEFPVVVGLCPKDGSTWFPELTDSFHRHDSIISNKSDDSVELITQRLARKDLANVIRSAPGSRSSSRGKNPKTPPIEAYHSFFKTNFMSPANLSHHGSRTSLNSTPSSPTS